MVGGVVSGQALTVPAAPRRRWRRVVWRILLGLGAVALVLAGVFVWQFGPSNVIGMLRYDQRREGDLKIGDRAPDVMLVELDGSTPVCLSDHLRGKPLVLIFGSYT
jgi:hypothetical protein